MSPKLKELFEATKPFRLPSVYYTEEVIELWATKFARELIIDVFALLAENKQYVSGSFDTVNDYFFTNHNDHNQ